MTMASHGHPSGRYFRAGSLGPHPAFGHPLPEGEGLYRPCPLSLWERVGVKATTSTAIVPLSLWEKAGVKATTLTAIVPLSLWERVGVRA